MQRYKILLVDDETDVRQSIARTVDWEAEGFVLCGCAGLPDSCLEDCCIFSRKVPRYSINRCARPCFLRGVGGQKEAIRFLEAKESCISST